jgi:hypothetical protein
MMHFLLLVIALNGAEVCGEVFLMGGFCGVLLGFLRKMGAEAWCFGGEVVVFCVVKVVIKQSPFVVTGNVTRIPDFFLAVPVLGIGT